MALREELIVARAELRKLWQQHPDWSLGQLARATGHGLAWVKTWLPRFKNAAPDDEKVLWGLPTTPKTPRTPPPKALLDRLEEMRDNPPAGLKRTPGPKTLLYYLAKDPGLQEKGITPPRSTSTVWRYLRRLGYLVRPSKKKRESLERAAPGTAMATDFKDSSCQTIDPDGKKHR